MPSSAYNRGVRRNITEFTMECEFCGKVFSTKTNLHRHQRTVTSCLHIQGKTLTGNICEYCNRVFPEKSGLNRHLLSCKAKREFDNKQNIKNLKIKCNKKISKLKSVYEDKIDEREKENKCLNSLLGEKDKRILELEKIIKEKDEEIVNLKIECGISKSDGRVEIYDKVCTKVLDKSTVTNNTVNVHPKLVNLPIANIHPLTEDYVKNSVGNGGYTFDHYLKGENGLVDFIYSITMSENEDGNIERNYVCTDPSRDSYHRLVETKEWKRDKGGKFVDVILDTLSDKVDNYHTKLFDERISKSKPKKLGYDPDYVYKLNTDMHSGIVQSNGKERKRLRQKIKKETSRKISV